MSNRSYRAYTMVEVLMVLGIIAVLAALTYAVAPAAKMSANVTKTKSNLRQIYVAISLYREDYNGGPVGDLADLGLPHILTIVKSPPTYLGLSGRVWESACSDHPKTTRQAMTYFPSEGGERLIKASVAHGERLLLVSDHQCNPPEVHVDSPYVTKRGLAVLLDGTLGDRTAEGNPNDPDWWALP